MKLAYLPYAVGLACLSLSQSGLAQQQQQQPQQLERVEITGSSIKRAQREGALPVQVITRQELDRAGIVSAEQLVQTLTINGHGLDNLAANSDVGVGSNRGNNGLSGANLRGQGSNATLVLLNGRRLAAHGLSGSVVDLNTIPMSAVARVEVLKDGASAIYGSDAVGGVINFILRRDFAGVEVAGSFDKTQEGGGDIGRFSLIGGFGNLEKDRFNIMASLSGRKNTLLRGIDRDFVNTFQPDRGLSVDTRGAPFATAVPISTIRNILSSRATPTGPIVNSRGPTEPGGTIARSGGINVLDLPGQAGCGAIDGMGPYDNLIWDFDAAAFACAWDTGRAAALQQPVENTNLVLRGTFAVNPNLRLVGEYVAANTTSRKIFSNNQISSSPSTASPFYNLVYPSTGSAYNFVFNSIAAVFPSIEENRGQGITFRWRCMPCGPREIETDAKVNRMLLAVEGNMGNWDYKAGYSRAESDVTSILAGGYYFNDRFVPLLAQGILNPFLRPGESQTPQALSALAAASATGTKLYGGVTKVDQLDASMSGTIGKLPGGDMMLAVGVDRRVEKFDFNGNASDVATQRNVFNAPFDAVNTLSGARRTVVAAYAELLMPIVKQLEVTAALRHDRYDGFGGSTNPKFSFKFTPTSDFALRGSAGTAFRVPTFAQIGFGVTESPYSGRDLVDPQRCPSLVVSSSDPNCAAIQPTTLNGGKPDLKPETARQLTLGFIAQVTPDLSLGADYWLVKREDRIGILSLTELLRNYNLFSSNFIRNSSGNIVTIDQRWINSGGSLTKGVEVGARYNTRLAGGTFRANWDISYLIDRRTRLLDDRPYGPSEVAKFSVGSDIPLRWKHTLELGYRIGPWNGSITQYYSSGYLDRVAPGVANRRVTPSNYNPNVARWITHNAALSYTGIKNLTLNFGIKNLFHRDPPFSAAYDSDTGAGSSWEPRVADPRGRSFLIGAVYKIF